MSRPPIASYLQGSWSKVSHAARELAKVFSVTFFSNISWSIGQNAPSTEGVSAHHWAGEGVQGSSFPLVKITTTFGDSATLIQAFARLEKFQTMHLQKEERGKVSCY